MRYQLSSITSNVYITAKQLIMRYQVSSITSNVYITAKQLIMRYQVSAIIKCPQLRQMFI